MKLKNIYTSNKSLTSLIFVYVTKHKYFFIILFPELSFQIIDLLYVREIFLNFFLSFIFIILNKKNIKKEKGS